MDKIGSVKFGGLNWDLIADDKKTKAAKAYYIKDKLQCQLIFATKHKGDDLPDDRIIENIYKCIVAAIVEMSEVDDEYLSDYFLYPFSAFLHQFVETDTFDGKGGTFKLGGVTYNAIIDNTHTYHGQINGENDFSIATIILSGVDDETGGDRHPDWVRFIYVHEVTHALMNIAGKPDHKEEFVKSFSIFLYEVLTTLMLYKDGVPVRVWPKN